MHPDLVALSGAILEGRYELGRVLGTGGMGAVFEARHLRLDRKVAIKVLRPVFTGHDDFVKRFLREAKAACRICHRNVVEILDFGEAPGGLLYSVMELLHGRDLQQLLEARPDGRLPWPQVHALLLQIVVGLKAVHARGIVHRDVKPANCFLTQVDGEPLVKLVDFGIAKLANVEQTQELTSTAQILGTPAYMAPELVRGTCHASARSDVYSVGVLAYRMLVGRLPFTGGTAFELLEKSCYEPVPSLREEVPEIPRSVEAFVLRLLAKEPEDRPPDMLVIRDDLAFLARATSLEAPEQGALLDLRGSLFSTTRTVAPAKLHGPSRRPSGNGSLRRGEPSMTATVQGKVTVDCSGEAADSHLQAAKPVRSPWAMVLAVVVGLVVFVVVVIVMSSLTTDDVSRPRPAEPSSVEADSSPEVVARPSLERSSFVSQPEQNVEEAPAGGVEAEPHVGVGADGGSTGGHELEPYRAAKPARGIPRADVAALKSLRSKIVKSCASLLKGKETSVSFIIQPSGVAVGLTSTPMDAAGRCAVAQVRNAKFRTREQAKPVILELR